MAHNFIDLAWGHRCIRVIRKQPCESNFSSPANTHRDHHRIAITVNDSSSGTNGDETTQRDIHPDWDSDTDTDVHGDLDSVAESNAECNCFSHLDNYAILNLHPCAHTDCLTDSISHVNADSHAAPDHCPNVDKDTAPNVDVHLHADEFTHAHCQPNADIHTHADPVSNVYSLADTHPHFNRQTKQHPASLCHTSTDEHSYIHADDYFDPYTHVYSNADFHTHINIHTYCNACPKCDSLADCYKHTSSNIYTDNYPHAAPDVDFNIYEHAAPNFNQHIDRDDHSDPNREFNAD